MFIELDRILDAAPSHPSEDVVGATANLAWVIDGASGLSDERVSGWDSDARWYAETLSQAIGAHALSTLTLSEIVENAIAAVAAEAKRSWSGIPTIPPSAAVAIVRTSGAAIEYFVLADCLVVLASDDQTMVISDSRVDDGNGPAMNALVTELAVSGNFERARAAAAPHLISRRQAAMNRPGGYWVASLETTAVQNAIVGSRVGVDTVLLATDGFARAVSTFAIFSDWGQLARSGIGLGEVCGAVRAAEDADANCVVHPRWSVHDDIAAIRLAPVALKESQAKS